MLTAKGMPRSPQQYLVPIHTRIQNIKKMKRLESQVSEIENKRRLYGDLHCKVKGHLSLIFGFVYFRYLPQAIHFSEFMAIFITRKRTKHSKSAIFVWYENGRRRLLRAQSIHIQRRSLCDSLKRVHVETIGHARSVAQEGSQSCLKKQAKVQHLVSEKMTKAWSIT